MTSAFPGQVLKPASVLVTGATGFLGSHIVAALRAALPKAQIVALVRRPEQREAFLTQGVQVIEGSLNAPAQALRDALCRFNGSQTPLDAVVHCAGGGEVVQLREVFEKNTDTTRNLLAALDPVKRFVLISSIAAQGPSGLDPRPLPEDAPARPMSAYGRSKLAAERLVLERAGDFPVSILRPPAIYGPGDRRMLPLFRAARRGFIPLLTGERSTSLISGKDCAQAVAHLLCHPHPTGWVGCVEEGPALTWRQIAEALSRALGVRRPFIVPVPTAALSVAAHLNQRWAAVKGQPTPFNTDKFQDMRQAHWVCHARGLRALGWLPSTSFSTDGAALTAQWYREHALL